MMNSGKTSLERAFEIAGAGTCASVEDIRRQLAREGFDRNQVSGPLLSRQLIEAVRKASIAAGRR